MADDQNQASSDDLLSLWGSGGQTSGTQGSSQPPPTQEKKDKESRVFGEEESSKGSIDGSAESRKIVEAGDEILDAEVIEEPARVVADIEYAEDDDSAGSKLDELLGELHLSKKHIFYALGCLMIVVVLIVGGIYSFRYFASSSMSAKPEPAMPGKTTQPTQPRGAGLNEAGITTAVQVGSLARFQINLVGETGVFASVALGTGPERGVIVAPAILTFRRIQNAYATSITDMLNAAIDRRARLTSHIALLTKLYNEGLQTQKEIVTQRADLQLQYNTLLVAQRTHDQNFFEQLSVFNTNTTETILNDFIAVSREVTRIRALHKALTSIQELYDIGLPKVAARIKDITLNQEALISGIKVYDVTGSDLQLIVPVAGSAAAASGGLSNGAFQSSPFRPIEVQTPNNYINEPGGGFSKEVNTSTQRE